jgi:hypothetical protein
LPRANLTQLCQLNFRKRIVAAEQGATVTPVVTLGGGARHRGGARYPLRNYCIARMEGPRVLRGGPVQDVQLQSLHLSNARIHHGTSELANQTDTRTREPGPNSSSLCDCNLPPRTSRIVGRMRQQAQNNFATLSREEVDMCRKAFVMFDKDGALRAGFCGSSGECHVGIKPNWAYGQSQGGLSCNGCGHAVLLHM